MLRLPQKCCDFCCDFHPRSSQYRRACEKQIPISLFRGDGLRLSSAAANVETKTVAEMVKRRTAPDCIGRNADGRKF